MRRTILKKLFVLFALLACALPAFPQAGNESKTAGVYVSTNYKNWSVPISGAAVAAASPATFTLFNADVALPDGRHFVPFYVGEVVNIGTGANAELVTLTAVSNCYLGAPNNTCTISGNTSNAHGQGDLVTSGTNGIGEATNDAGRFGGGLVYWENDGGVVSLSTSGATTTVCTSCIPINGIVLGVVARVTTTITSCTGGWELGDGTTATRFTAANTTLTAGTVSAADLQTTSGVASTTTGMLNITTAKNIVNTCVTSNAGAGAVHVKAFGYILATPNN